MAAKKRGLGKNSLDMLLGASSPIIVDEEEKKHIPAANMDQLDMLSVDVIEKGRYQPRRDFDPQALEELASSIKAQGIIQPVVVRKTKTDHYELIAGERRWRAAKLAGLTEIPAIIRDLPDETVMAVALIENIQRKDLNPIEEAQAIQRLGNEFNLTHQDIAEAIGRSRVAVTNLLRLLNLNPDVKELLEQGQIEMGHARALLTLDHKKQSQVAMFIVEKGLSVRETEAYIRQLQTKRSPTTQSKPIDPDVLRLEHELADKLGAHVSLQHSQSGKGKLVIQYNTLEELEGILEHIQ